MSSTTDLADIRLAFGGHNKPEDGLCFNEAVAYFRGVPHTDAPACVSPTIRRFTMRLNDRLNDEERQILVPYIPRVVGTNTGNPADEETRRFMCMDWLVHEALPGLLRQGGLIAEAELLEGLVAVTDSGSYEESRRALGTVRDKTWKIREVWREGIHAKVKAEMEKRGKPVAVAVADAAAAAAAVAAAAADAAAVADAAAAAAADAAAAAAAAAAADAGTWGKTYNDCYDAAYKAAKPVFEKAYEPITAGLRQSSLLLLDRMIEVGRVPVA